MLPLLWLAFTAPLAGEAEESECTEHGIVSTLDGDGEFRAVQTAFVGGAREGVRLPRETMAALEAVKGAALGVTPFAAFEDSKPAKKGTASQNGKRTGTKETEKRGAKR